MDVEMFLKYQKARAEARRWKNKYMKLEQYGKKLPSDSELISKLVDIANDPSTLQMDTAVLDAAIKKLRSMEWKTGTPNEPGRYLVTIVYPMAVKGSVTLLKWRRVETYSKGMESKSEMCWVDYDHDYGYYKVDGRVIGWMPLPEEFKEDRE